MKKLEYLGVQELNDNEIVKLEGGSCATAAIGLGLSLAAATLITGPVGAAIFAASFINGSISLAHACGSAERFEDNSLASDISVDAGKTEILTL